MGLKPQMKITGNGKPRPKPLDLYRRAELLGVTAGHLSQVISGKRQSAILLVRVAKLIESETPTTKGKI
jgi:hypothetical protein